MQSKWQKTIQIYYRRVSEIILIYFLQVNNISSAFELCEREALTFTDMTPTQANPVRHQSRAAHYIELVLDKYTNHIHRS